MDNLLRLPPGEHAPHTVHAVVEVPKNSANKYEYDPKQGSFHLDRVLYSPMHYPGDYGFIPSTIAGDGDPLDILVLVSEPTFPGCVLQVRPIGLLEMTDDKGPDEKVLAVPLHDPRYDDCHALNDIAGHRLQEIEHFFAIYKELEGKTVTVNGWRDQDVCHALIRETIAAFRRQH